MDIFKDTVEKFVSNVEIKGVRVRVNKDNGEDVVINKEGDNYSLSQLDNAYIIAYATDKNTDSGREFIGHVIKKFLEKEKDMEKLKKFLKDLLNAPNRLHNDSFMHFFSINLVGNEEKVKLLEDLIKLGGYIELDRIGEREIKKDKGEIEKIKTRLRNLSIEETLKKQLYDKEVVKAVEETPIGELPEELQAQILGAIGFNNRVNNGVNNGVNIGGKRRKSLKKKRKSKRKVGGTKRGTKRKYEYIEETPEERAERLERIRQNNERTERVNELQAKAEQDPEFWSVFERVARDVERGNVIGTGVAAIDTADEVTEAQQAAMQRVRDREQRDLAVEEAAESVRISGGMVKTKRRKSMKKKQRKTKRKGRK